MTTYHAFVCSGCGWTYGNITVDHTTLHVGTAVLYQDCTIRCPRCGCERRWYASRLAKAARKRRKELHLDGAR